jgi:hypothetical protein
MIVTRHYPRRCRGGGIRGNEIIIIIIIIFEGRYTFRLRFNLYEFILCDRRD